MYSSIILKLTCLINHEDTSKASELFRLNRIFKKRKVIIVHRQIHPSLNTTQTSIIDFYINVREKRHTLSHQ